VHEDSGFEPRFLFRGYATGVSGNIRRLLPLKEALEEEKKPDKAKHRRYGDSAFPTIGSIALPMFGGVSRAEWQNANAYDREGGRVLTVGRVRLEAIGDYDSPQEAVRFTGGNHAKNNLATLTTVRVEIDDLQIFVNSKTHGRRDPRVTVGHISSFFQSIHPRTDHKEPKIRFLAKFDGLTIDGVSIGVHLVDALLERERTFQELKSVYAGNKKDFPVYSAGSSEAAICTIVTKLDGDPGKTGITFDPNGHIIHVPDFGTIYLGEMILTSEERRLSMMRIQLHSPEGGDISAAGSVVDGSSWPP